MSEKKKMALSDDERMAIKYRFLRDKIIFNFNKGKRILKITKIVITAIFILFTLIGIYVSHRTGHEIQWLQAWIILIFINVALSVIADYSKYLIESKVIPYLENDEEIEFGEYDIFIEDIDGESEDDEEDEED
jgi:hypothetical protein